ncbi:MAG TPA: hypothetical protein P5119_04985 [Candidatus Aminicenantes bacterium]|nr:hypothetical protein [Candidatus Aminicenantes bacterium]HRY64682.1 hypothetical protein [Candidatus Aminicenantes bacterium]HRZ71595.1 hypothetical protein [Candidatus Aminicenantes bacterium]
MNKMTEKAALLALAFIVSIPLGLAAQDEGFYPYSFARLTYVNGPVYVQRTSDLGYEKGEVNLALVQGDKIGTENGQAEIHFGRRNYLRLGQAAKVEFAILPKEGEDRIKLFLTEGQAYLRVSQLALEKGIEVHTPDASFYVLEEGLYRFDVRLDRETRAVAREGSLEAAAEEGSVLIRSGETVTAADGRLVSEPEYDYARGDAFDEWNDGRDGLLSARSERQYLPSDMGEYEEELGDNGRWVYEQPYGNVWVPNVTYYDDWRPYYYGRWVWYPVVGWTWVSSEPWGWAVYHYGRWNWRFGLGWYWIPRSHWGPAWVHWWHDRDYVGWCPLTWYNRPGYLFHDRFYDRWDDRFSSAHNRAMTVVRRDHLQSPDIGRRHVGAADLDRIGRVELRAQQPGIRPAVDNARPQALEARRALADRTGARERIRNVAPSRALASPRPGGLNTGLRSRERNSAGSSVDRPAVTRPAVRGAGSGGRAVRTYQSQRPSESRSVRSQGRIYSSRPTVAAPSSRLNSRSGSSRPEASSYGRAGSSRAPSSVQSRSGRSSSRSLSSPKNSPSSPGRTYSAPRSNRPSSSSSGRSFSSPSSSRSSSGRAFSAPRSNGSSGRSSSGSSRPSGSIKSGGSSSGRSGSPSRSSSGSSRSSGSSSRSSGSSSRSGGEARKKG